MSRNFALLQIAGKEQEFFQPASSPPKPELVTVAAPAAELETVSAHSIFQGRPDQEPLRFEMESWQLEELTKLVRGIFLEPGGECNHAVVLASTESGNGCSWICARAGELLASRVAGRVCLVDAHFGRATFGRTSFERTGLGRTAFGRAGLHEHFGVPNHQGLSDALREEGPIGGYVSQLSRRNLALVSAGSDVSPDRGDRPGDRSLTASERMRWRLQELRAEFDYVLVDGGSLDEGDESIALAGMADGIVLVLQAHSTRKERTRGRVQDLKFAGVRILGAVLNQPAG